MPPRPRPVTANPPNIAPTTSSFIESPAPVPPPAPMPASSDVQSDDTVAKPLKFSFLKKRTPVPPVPFTLDDQDDMAVDVKPDIASLAQSHTSFLNTWKAGKDVPEIAQDSSDPEIEELTVHAVRRIYEAPPGFQRPSLEPDESNEPTVSIRLSTRDGMVAYLDEHVALQEEVADIWERMEEMKERLEEMLSDFSASK
ncbi:hypothetical protein EDB83DRAFT_2319160 [Lactarius deliciosus]|nr:hypothetical protein EDB83DRAFT_2319160 [Lactarius deliciosus]